MPTYFLGIISIKQLVILFNKNGIDIQFAYIVTIKKKRLVIKHNGYYPFLLFRQSLKTFVR